MLEDGSFAEKRDHIAEIITEFIEPGMFDFSQMAEGASHDAASREASPAGDSPLHGPISQNEIEQFVRVDLNRIDEAGYFRKYFG